MPSIISLMARGRMPGCRLSPARGGRKGRCVRDSSRRRAITALGTHPASCASCPPPSGRTQTRCHCSHPRLSAPCCARRSRTSPCSSSCHRKSGLRGGETRVSRTALHVCARQCLTPHSPNPYDVATRPLTSVVASVCAPPEPMTHADSPVVTGRRRTHTFTLSALPPPADAAEADAMLCAATCDGRARAAGLRAGCAGANVQQRTRERTTRSSCAWKFSAPRNYL